MRALQKRKQGASRYSAEIALILFRKIPGYKLSGG